MSDAPPPQAEGGREPASEGHNPSALSTGEASVDLSAAAEAVIAACAALPQGQFESVLRQLSFPTWLLHILDSCLRIVVPYCQTSILTARQLGWEDPTPRLREEVGQGFLRSHAKTVDAYPAASTLPLETFRALYAYMATGDMSVRSLAEVLEIRRNQDGLERAITANIETALLHHVLLILKSAGIDCALQQCRHGRCDSGIRLRSEYPRKQVEAALSTLPNEIRCYYLRRDMQETTGNHFDTVDALYIF